MMGIVGARLGQKGDREQQHQIRPAEEDAGADTTALGDRQRDPQRQEDADQRDRDAGQRPLPGPFLPELRGHRICPISSVDLAGAGGPEPSAGSAPTPIRYNDSESAGTRTFATVASAPTRRPSPAGVAPCTRMRSPRSMSAKAAFGRV